MSAWHRHDDLDGIDPANILHPKERREAALKASRRVRKNLREEYEDPVPDDQIPSVFVSENKKHLIRSRRQHRTTHIWP